MPQRKTPKLPANSQPLQLRTLSGVYESARAVVRALDVPTTATYSQFAAKLKSLAQPRQIDQLKALFTALNQLHKHSGTLGSTTLVTPADHPLVVRDTFTKE